MRLAQALVAPPSATLQQQVLQRTASQQQARRPPELQRQQQQESRKLRRQVPLQQMGWQLVSNWVRPSPGSPRIVSRLVWQPREQLQQVSQQQARRPPEFQRQQQQESRKLQRQVPLQQMGWQLVSNWVRPLPGSPRVVSRLVRQPRE